MARNLHLGVVAEGVENKSQLAFLKSLKCDEVQGYLIGHPVSGDEFISRFK
ncbi:MAG: EAL domain-containing protein [Thiotrichaceae bacterium]